jgi:hypothetical protein
MRSPQGLRSITLPLETFFHAFLMTQRLAVTGNSLSIGRTNQCTPNLLASQIYEWGMREGSGVLDRLVIRAITTAIRSIIAVPATKTVTKAMSKAVLA